MDLSIIIVSWNVKEKLRANLSALLASKGDFRREIFVVDNFSQDGSATMVASEFSEVKLIANQENLGFAKANNQAIKLASGRYILLLNPDMRVYPDTLQKSLAWARDNQSAVVSGCRLEDEQGKLIKHVRRFPKLLDQLVIILKLPHIFPNINSRYLYTNFNYDQAAQVDSVRGAFFLINTEAYQKISQGAPLLLDEQYFIWFEEVDFCRQVYKFGGEVWYQSNATCLDYVGQSFKQVNRKNKQKYFCDSMLKYFRKWKPKWQAKILTYAWRWVGMFI